MFITGPFTDPVVYDFWLMIWQQKPSAIVMVTNAIENTKVWITTHNNLFLLCLMVIQNNDNRQFLNFDGKVIDIRWIVCPPTKEAVEEL